MNRDQQEFIKRFENKMEPVVEHPETLKAIESGKKVTDVEIEKTLHDFETKVFYSENAEAPVDARRIIFEAAEPLAFSTADRLIQALRNDERVRSICLLADDLAGKRFEEAKDLSFRRLENPSGPVIAEIPGPCDVAIATIEPPDSPNSLLLYGGKSAFGVKKLFFLAPAWLGIGSTGGIFEKGRRKNMDEVDGIFCADEFAKRIIHSQWKDFPEDRILVTGVPLLDTLEQEKASQYRQEGRRKFGIDSATIAVWFSGDISSAYQEKGWGVDERINEKTFFQAFAAIRETASLMPDKKFAFLVRPHPRDSNKEEILSLVNNPGDLPLNLKVLRATDKEASISELRYASDASIGILPTEGFVAPFLGREAALLAFKEKGMGRQVFERIYKDESVRQLFAKNKNPKLINSPDELVKYLSGLETASELQPIVSNDKPQKSATERILDIVLA